MIILDVRDKDGKQVDCLVGENFELLTGEQVGSFCALEETKDNCYIRNGDPFSGTALNINALIKKGYTLRMREE